MLSINHTDWPIQEHHKPPWDGTCPSDQRASICVFQPPEDFIFCSFPPCCGANHRSPLATPSRRLSEDAPSVTGISLMKKGWCLSHYTCSEWEDLRTNLLALTREDTCLLQKLHFPAAGGNKRTRFVLTLIRWENREFPKEIKKGKGVGVGPCKFP